MSHHGNQFWERLTNTGPHAELGDRISRLRHSVLRQVHTDADQDDRLAALEIQLALLSRLLLAKGIVTAGDLSRLQQETEAAVQATHAPFVASEPAPDAAADISPASPELDALARAAETRPESNP